MSHLILVRHGQSEWNLQNRFTGWVDVDLAPKGKLEACKAGESIKELNINIISLAYGGSVNSSSSKEILSLEEVNGLLIGGASLEAKEFSKIVNSIEN